MRPNLMLYVCSYNNLKQKTTNPDLNLDLLRNSCLPILFSIVRVEKKHLPRKGGIMGDMSNNRLLAICMVGAV